MNTINKTYNDNDNNNNSNSYSCVPTLTTTLRTHASALKMVLRIDLFNLDINKSATYCVAVVIIIIIIICSSSSSSSSSSNSVVGGPAPLDRGRGGPGLPHGENGNHNLIYHNTI